MKAAPGTSVEVGIAALKLLLDDLLQVRQHALPPGTGVGRAVPDALAQRSVGLEHPRVQQPGIAGRGGAGQIQEVQQRLTLGAEPCLLLRHLARHDAQDVQRDPHPVAQAAVGEGRHHLAGEEVAERFERQGYVIAAKTGGAGPGGLAAPDPGRLPKMACTAKESWTATQ